MPDAGARELVGVLVAAGRRGLKGVQEGSGETIWKGVGENPGMGSGIDASRRGPMPARTSELTS